jgi:hypothetical protein
MTDLKVIIAIQDSELEDEELQEYTQNLLPQIREFDGVEEAGLVPQDQPIEIPGMTSKDFGVFILGAITFIATVKTVTEIIDWVEKRWLKPKSQASERKVMIEIITPEGYKITYSAGNPEDLKAFRDQIVKQVGESQGK